jgi:branched-subunit amino acid transport protein AzlD
MTIEQHIITIAVVIAGTSITRVFPFFIFPENKKTPDYITYFGTVLPPAVIGLLIVYCLKDAVFTSMHGLPEVLVIFFVAVLHKWKKNMFLSLATGTILYMFWVQC